MNSDNITNELNRVQQGQRARTLGEKEVQWAIDQAREIGVAYRTGGTVANAYRYPAYTTAVVAVRAGDDVWYRAARVNAKGSPVTWAGIASTRDRDAHAWAEKFTPGPEWVRAERSDD